MAYCTQNDILDQIDEDVLIQLTDDDDAGVVDADVVSQKIADADALINGYCGQKYAVPFSSVPELVKKFSVDIAIYNLYGRRKGAPEDVRNRYKDAVDYLKGVASGNNSLGVQPDPDPPGEDDYAGANLVSARDKMFDSDTMSKY